MSIRKARESVYGWYPSANDTYTKPFEQHGYDQETFVRFWKAQYDLDNSTGNSEPIVKPAAGTKSVSRDEPRDVPRGHSRDTPKSSGQRVHKPAQVRLKSAPTAIRYITPRATPVTVPTSADPRSRGSASLSTTPTNHQEPGVIRWNLQKEIKSRPRKGQVAPPNATPVPVRAWSPIPTPFSTPTPKPLLRDEPIYRSVPIKKERVKSATIQREKKVKSSRLVKSAGPTRPFYTGKQQQQQQQPTLNEFRRPCAPVPPRPSDIDLQDIDDETIPEYENQLNQNGWRMELHKDPLRLKKVPKRLPYTVDCPVKEVPPKPPKAHMENYDTYFYNTIPRRRYTFTIDKEWASEVLLPKRLELQKKQPIRDTRYKNFSFVY